MTKKARNEQQGAHNEQYYRHLDRVKNPHHRRSQRDAPKGYEGLVEEPGNHNAVTGKHQNFDPDELDRLMDIYVEVNATIGNPRRDNKITFVDVDKQIAIQQAMYAASQADLRLWRRDYGGPFVHLRNLTSKQLESLESDLEHGLAAHIDSTKGRGYLNLEVLPDLVRFHHEASPGQCGRCFSHTDLILETKGLQRFLGMDFNTTSPQRRIPPSFTYWSWLQIVKDEIHQRAHCHKEAKEHIDRCLEAYLKVRSGAARDQATLRLGADDCAFLSQYDQGEESRLRRYLLQLQHDSMPRRDVPAHMKTPAYCAIRRFHTFRWRTAYRRNYGPDCFQVPDWGKPTEEHIRQSGNILTACEDLYDQRLHEITCALLMKMHRRIEQRLEYSQLKSPSERASSTNGNQCDGTSVQAEN
jgi:hypothetical protein